MNNAAAHLDVDGDAKISLALPCSGCYLLCFSLAHVAMAIKLWATVLAWGEEDVAVIGVGFHRWSLLDDVVGCNGGGGPRGNASCGEEEGELEANGSSILDLVRESSGSPAALGIHGS